MSADAQLLPVVIKVGGSTSQGQSYKHWLDALRQATRPFVIVPGGGPFADTIRSNQQSLGFNDATAHELAILSMNQFGRVLLQHLDDSRPLHHATQWTLESHSRSVWLPDPDELKHDSNIEQSWRTTGDALACWLCHQLGIRQLVMIKSVDPFALAQPMATLTQKGIIDPLCKNLIDNFNISVNLLGATQTDSLSALLAHNSSQMP